MDLLRLWIIAAASSVFCMVVACSVTPVVSVERPVLVSRGGRVDLRPALRFNLGILPASTSCRVSNVVKTGSSCGAVTPSTFDCKSYSGPILYQHHGCFSPKELATFMISTQHPDNSVQASILSVEVNVEELIPPLTGLKVNVSSNQKADGTLKLTLVFPYAMVSWSHYEILSDWSMLSLPFAGHLQGPVNQPLPSGYISTTPLIYHSHHTMPQSYTDYICIKIYIRKSNNSLHNVYIILPFRTHAVAGLGGNTDEVGALDRDVLVVKQVVNTPVVASDFETFNNTISFASPGNLDHFSVIRYSFPVLKAGSFQSLDTTSINVTHSVFTSDELLNGYVSFHPDVASSSIPVIYYYNVTNIAGVIIARGEMAVLVNERQSQWPSQRTNLPLAVTEGGMSIINQSTLEFYLPSQGCEVQASMRVLKPPSHGNLLYLNGSNVGRNKIFLWILRNTSIMYKHSGDEEQGDIIYWEVLCSPGPVLQVVMSVLVVPVDDVSPTLNITSELMMYQGWALPFSPSLFQVTDPDSPRETIRFRISGQKGTLFRAQKNITDFDNSSLYFPMFPLDALFPHITSGEFYKVEGFEMQDLDQQRIWYVPNNESDRDSIRIVTNDISNQGVEIQTLHIAVSSIPLNVTLQLSTSITYPCIIRNKPIPLSEAGHMYLTLHFLYSHAPSISPENIWYVVQSSPQNGTLCVVAHSECSTSVSSFSQQDINHHRIIYRPSNNFLGPDHFTYMVTIQGVCSVHCLTHVFNWTWVQPDIFITDKQFWLNAGSDKKITTKFFRIFSNLFGTKIITFQIIEPPQYGNLILRNATHLISVKPVSFTYKDLQGRLLLYNHTQRQQHAETCIHSDYLKFDAVTPQHRVRGNLPIIFKNGDKVLSVDIHSHVHIGAKHFTFTNKDFSISSSFCPEYIQFTLRIPPKRGKISLKDHIHKTERELVAGSTFTAKDIQTGVLSYSLILSDHLATNTSDSFVINGSDPSSQWPRKTLNRNVNHNGSDVDHFVVFVVPSPNVSYILAVDISTGHPLTWLPDYQSYGYMLVPSDIDLLNSTLQPNEVVIQLEEGPMFGNFERNGAPASYFAVEGIITGNVAYLKNSLIPERVFSDVVQLHLYAYLPEYTTRTLSHRFELEWALVEFEQATVVVSEVQNSVQIYIRRKGKMWFESHVLVETISGTASSQENCSQHAQASSSGGDFCKLRTEVVFPVGEAVQGLTVKLLDDNDAEGMEYFYLQLLKEEGLSNAILHGKVKSKVIIDDMEDYKTVAIEGQEGRNTDCQLETTVEEQSGQVFINLTRSGNLNSELGVICYTEDSTARANSDYIPRPHNSLESEVIFPMYESVTECAVRIIDDHNYEPRERFLIRIGTTSTYGFVNINPASSSICIYISYDENDGPVVTFNQTQMVVQESETEIRLGTFALLRKGPELNFTTLVKYNNHTKDEDSAEKGVDFRLFTDRDCTLEGDYSPGGCVRFAPGQTVAILSVEILPDRLVEGDEVFHLRIIYVRDGRRSNNLQQSILKVTILDATQPAYVEFVNLTTFMKETSGKNVIKIRRRGNLQGQTNVECKLKGGSAKGGIDITIKDGSIDFLAPLSQPPPDRAVTFEPGDNQTVCHIFILDDKKYEGLENLTVILDLVSESDRGRVILSPDTFMSTIYISDPEDVPVVQFSPTTDMIQVLEPLSNSMLDAVNLIVKVQRSGDTDLISNITYSTIDSSAKSGQDFIYTSGIVTFHKGENSTIISVSILANHLSNVDSMFSLLLSMPSYPTTIRNNQVNVTITNRVLLGPYFSSVPQLDNVYHGTRHFSGGEYFDLPLACITPCDLAFDARNDNDWEVCQRQNISNQLTIYTWEVSMSELDGFRAVNSTSTFTLPNPQELQTVYLNPNLYVRCIVWPVDNAGTKGYPRTSTTVQLTRQYYDCYEDESVLEGKISTYDAFTAADEDMVRLDFTITAFPNKIPLFSMVPQSLGHEFHLLSPDSLYTTITTTTNYSCSNFNQFDSNSLLGHYLMKTDSGIKLQFKSLYSHINHSSCRWEFSAWYPLSVLQHTCHGEKDTRTTGAGAIGENVISVWVASTSIHVGESGLTFESNTMNLLEATFPVLDTSNFLPPPLHILSQFGHILPHVFPLSFQEDNHGRIQLYLYSAAPANYSLLPSSNSQYDIQLLYMDGVENSQMWLVELEQNLDHAVVVFTDGENAPMRCKKCDYEPIMEYTFRLPLQVSDEEGRRDVTLLLNTTATLQDEILFIGERVNVSVELCALESPQHGLTLQVQQLFLCELVGERNCSSRLDIGSEEISSRFDLEVRSSHSHLLSFTFATDAIILVTSPGHWFLHMRIGLSTSTFYREMVLPLTFLSPPPLTTFENTLPPSEIAPNEVTQTLYAAIGMLTAIIILLVICLAITLAIVCASQGKSGFYAKTSALRNSHKDSFNGKLNSVHHTLIDNDKIVKRTNSTIGFPTQESRMSRQETRIRKRERLESNTKSLTIGLQRSQSLPSFPLPSLTVPFINNKPPLLTHTHGTNLRVNLNRVHTRIKKINIEHSRLSSWTREQLKRNRTLDNLRIVQDLAIRHKNYGVNEIQHRTTGTGPYARYVVRSLAASAKTPEPGSKPITEL